MLSNDPWIDHMNSDWLAIKDFKVLVKQYMVNIPPFFLLFLKDALQLKTQFYPFMMLPEERQGALYHLFQELLLHEDMVIQLEDVVTSGFLNTHYALFKPGFLFIKQHCLNI